MRKQLHEIQEIDQYVLREMSAADQLVFQARMLACHHLQEKVEHQLQAHALVRRFAREAQREQLSEVYDRLWETDASFRSEITAIFK
ncbi:hypothetical protein [Chitinophaga japonensis]|uniref:Uncharacterized protein n=1 Tax=Chitinophaga japonensis TaxID=104662 RepID=A0A562TCQ2_CHIJA|nr:hypothetical protein [Chitinophaga japonensis]TWI91282.1 hypothetical protein LX66_0647 [Chitinophaga japonensis]